MPGHYRRYLSANCGPGQLCTHVLNYLPSQAIVQQGRVYSVARNVHPGPRILDRFSCGGSERGRLCLLTKVTVWGWANARAKFCRIINIVSEGGVQELRCISPKVLSVPRPLRLWPLGRLPGSLPPSRRYRSWPRFISMRCHSECRMLGLAPGQRRAS